MRNELTSATNPLRVDFIAPEELDLPGRIGMTFAPGKKQPGGATACWNRDLDTDLRALRNEFKTDLLVSLIEEREFLDLKIPNLLDQVRLYGMEILWFPIPDQSVPESHERFDNLVRQISERVREGKTVVIHCKGGLGRTGLVAAAVLLAITKLSPEEAISTVRQARDGTIENRLQEDFVRSFHQRIQAS
jgi:protein-tyrosine phosphatase